MQVKMRSYWMRVDPTPMTDALKRGNLDTKTHRHKGDKGGD